MKRNICSVAEFEEKKIKYALMGRQHSDQSLQLELSWLSTYKWGGGGMNERVSEKDILKTAKCSNIFVQDCSIGDFA